MILERLVGRRAEKRAMTSAELARELAARSGTAAGVDVTPERALAYSVVFACVRVLAESVGQLPLHLYQRKGREKLQAIDHPLYPLLYAAPSERQTSQEFWEFMTGCLALRGNAYAQIIRVGAPGRGRVAELVPLDPRGVRPCVDPETREITYELHLGGGVKDTLPEREVLHIRLMPLNGVLGASVIQYAREAIGLGIGAEKYGATLFRNGASPGGVLQSPGMLSDTAYNRLRDSWEERHAGADNAHRIAILEEGVTWKEIGMPAKDAQFLETRKYQRSEIAGLFRVPPHMIGDLERATFSNIEHQSIDFVAHGLVPYLRRIEQRITLQLLTPAERRELFAKFSVGGLLRGDMTARAAFYRELVNLGALSPNEVRDLEDMNPREGGDVYLTPLNMAINGRAPGEETDE